MDRRKVIVIAAALIAVLGAGVVFLYVKSADSRADQKFAAEQVLVAKAQINQGETLAAAQTAGKLEVKSVSASSVAPDAVAAASQIGDGKVALGAIYPGQQILTSNFGDTSAAATTGDLQIPKGDVAIAVSLDDTGRVAGFVNPGNFVTIYMTSSKDNTTSILLPSVSVIAVGATSTVPQASPSTDPNTGQPVADPNAEVVPKTMFTLALSPQDGQKVVNAAKNGTLTFGLLPASATTTSPAADAASTK